MKVRFMKEKFIKLWNNRKFRTFAQTTLSTLLVYFAGNKIFDVDLNAFICIIISAVATGLSAIMPIIEEKLGDNVDAKS